MAKLTKSQRAKVERALRQHDRHKNCYFWTPDGTASGRRRCEKENTWSVSFKHDGKIYSYDSLVDCSCKNYYYTGTFAVDGVKKNRRAFSALLPKTAQ